MLLNANNRVKRLVTPARTLDYDYDALGRIRMVEDSADGRRDYFHDEQGRLVSVLSVHGEELLTASYGSDSVRLAESGLGFSYDLTRSQRIAAVWDGSVRFDAEYDANDDLAAVSYSGLTVRFERDPLGRLVATTYPSGFRSRYFHDLLGNRQLVEFDSGASVAYSHDPAGNIVGAEVRDKDGTTRRQTTTVGRMNRVERIAYDPGRTLDVDYDKMGRPTVFDDGGRRIVVEYEANGTPSRLSDPGTGESVELRRRRPPGGRSMAVRRLAAFSRDIFGGPHPHYGPVRFAETTFDVIPLDAEEIGVPDLAKARDLFDVALSLFGDEAHIIPAFEKPSNPLFQPAEYRSTNCCVASGGSSCGPSDPLGGYGGGAELTARQQAAHHGIAVKDSADLSILQPTMTAIFDNVVQVWKRHAPGVTPVITSGREWHEDRKPNSKHYTGEAFDLRTRDFTRTQIETLARALQSSIGHDYQVVIKPNHIHVEYDTGTS